METAVGHFLKTIETGVTVNNVLPWQQRELQPDEKDKIGFILQFYKKIAD